MKKRILSLALALVMALSLLPVASLAAEEYGDVAGHWAESSIERWSGYNIVEGDGGNFYPNRSLTRGEMAKIIANTLGLTEEGEENPFDDVPADAWYAPYVLRCYVAGIMEGSAGHANPTDIITRQETMVILGRALGMEPVENADLSAFDDGETVADWAKGYVAAMTQANIVNGVSEGVLAPTDSINRASILAILDRSIALYANEDGAEIDAANTQGLILIVAKNVTVTNAPEGTKVLASVGAEGATVNGKSISAGEAVTAEKEDVKQTMTADGGSGGSGGGGGGGNRPSTPTYSDLTIDEAKTVSEGTYKNVTISADVGDGTVTLANVTIQQDLIIRGGGANTVNLDTVTIGGKVILDKTLTETSTELPRLNLTGTEVKQVEVKQAAILEGDSDSAIQSVTASANTTVQGSNTTVTTVEIPAGEGGSAVELTVNGGSVSTVNAKGEATVKGTGKVENVKAEADVSVDSTTVGKVEVPATVAENVSVAISGSGSVEVAVDSDKGAAITTSNGASVEISTNRETNPDVTVDGSAVTHIHKWKKTGETAANCTQNGERTYTCTAEGCDTDDQTEGAQPATKTEEIPALGHDPAAEWKSDGNNHWHVCQREGCGAKVGEVSHTWTGKWTYVDAEHHKDTCTICKYDEVQEHNVVTDDAIDATCTTAGKTEGSHCDQCNQVLKAQTDVKAKGHDFKNGEVKYDADGHWHVCGNKGCEETDSKTAHSYPANAKCDEKTACSAGCGYEKPAEEHAWGAWSKQDGTYHVHTCSLCGTTATEAHKWDNGTVTTEPEGETDGVKTYTCTVEGCNATKTEAVPARKIWYTHTTYSTLPYLYWYNSRGSNEVFYYTVNDGTPKSSGTNYVSLYNLMVGFMHETESKKITINIKTGPYNSTPTKELCSTEFELVMEEAGDFTIAPQESGYYKVSGGAEGYDGYFYRLIDKDGNEVACSYTNKGGDILSSGAPYEGCVFEISQFKFEFEGEGEPDGYTVTCDVLKKVTVTKAKSFTLSSENNNLPIQPEGEAHVSTHYELYSALNKGGKVILDADIESSGFSVSAGAPVTLDLNGHTISFGTTGRLSVSDGKEFVLDGTKEGSALIPSENASYSSEINADSYAILTVKGLTVKNVGLGNARKATFEDVNFTELESLGRVSEISISGGSISGTRVGGLYVYECGKMTFNGGLTITDDLHFTDCTNVILDNVTVETAEGQSKGHITFKNTTANLKDVTLPEEGGMSILEENQGVSNVTIESGTYFDEVEKGINITVCDASTLTVKGGTINGTIRMCDTSKLVMNDGTIDHIEGGHYSYGSTDWNCTVVMNGGTIGEIEAGATLGDVSCPCQLTVNGGKIGTLRYTNKDSTITVNNGAIGYFNGEESHVTITGGTFEKAQLDGVVTISGGSFTEGEAYGSCGVGASEGAVSRITGGIFDELSVGGEGVVYVDECTINRELSVSGEVVVSTSTPKLRAGYSVSDAKLTIRGGTHAYVTLESNNTCVIEGGKATRVNVDETAVLTVNGGEATKVYLDPGVYGSTSKATLNLIRGTAAVYPYNGATINMTGGLLGMNKTYVEDSETLKITISGGVCHFDPSEYLAENCTATKDESKGAWIVSNAGDDNETENITLSYAKSSDGLVEVRSNVTDVTKEYRLLFTDDSGGTYDFDISCLEYSSYNLYCDFVNKSPKVYTKLEWQTVENSEGSETKTTIATLDKKLTVQEIGDAIKITKFSAFATDLTFDVENIDKNGCYICYYEKDDEEFGYYVPRISGSSLKVEASKGAVGCTFYILKVTGAVDGDGNATLNYTPKGEGQTN